MFLCLGGYSGLIMVKTKHMQTFEEVSIIGAMPLGKQEKISWSNKTGQIIHEVGARMGSNLRIHCMN